jgi:hypothetical protein
VGELIDRGCNNDRVRPLRARGYSGRPRVNGKLDCSRAGNLSKGGTGLKRRDLGIESIFFPKSGILGNVGIDQVDRRAGDADVYLILGLRHGIKDSQKGQYSH